MEKQEVINGNEAGKAALQRFAGKLRELRKRAGITPEERVRFDLALAEVVRYSFLEVTGEFQKRYRLHPLTLNFLTTGLIEQWQKNQYSGFSR